MLDKLESMINKVIGRSITSCPGDEPHEVVNPASLTAVIGIMLAVAVWAFNAHGQDIALLKQEGSVRPTYVEMEKQLKQVIEAQGKIQQANFTAIAHRIDGQQQVQQQLTTNQGDLIRSVASIQAAVNILLKERHPEAFDGIAARSEAFEAQQLAQVEMLVNLQVKQFRSLLSNVNNPIIVNENSHIFVLESDSSDISYTFAESAGTVKLFMDSNSYDTDIDWAIIEEALVMRAQVDSSSVVPLALPTGTDTNG